MLKRNTVYINSDGGTCLVVGEEGGRVEFVAMNSTALQVETLPASDFDKSWSPHDFPLERAVKRYVEAVRATKSPAFLVNVLEAVLAPKNTDADAQQAEATITPEVVPEAVTNRDSIAPAEMLPLEAAKSAIGVRGEDTQIKSIGATSIGDLLDSAELLDQQTQSAQEKRTAPGFKETLQSAPKARTPNPIQEANRAHSFGEPRQSEAPQSNVKEIHPMQVQNENVAAQPLEETAYQVHVAGSSVTIEMGKTPAPTRTPASFEDKPLSVAVPLNSQPSYFVAVDESGLPVRFVTKTVEDRAVNATLVGNWVAEGYSVSTVSLRDFRRLLGKLDAAMKAAEVQPIAPASEPAAQTPPVEPASGVTSESANDAGAAQSPENSAAA